MQCWVIVLREGNEAGLGGGELNGSSKSDPKDINAWELLKSWGGYELPTVHRMGGLTLLNSNIEDSILLDYIFFSFSEMYDCKFIFEAETSVVIFCLG